LKGDWSDRLKLGQNTIILSSKNTPLQLQVNYLINPTRSQPCSIFVTRAL